MFGAAVAYDEVKYKYTDLQSLVASCFATGQVLHKAYDEVRDLFITLMQSLASNRFALGRVLHKAYDEIKDIINHNDAVTRIQSLRSWASVA